MIPFIDLHFQHRETEEELRREVEGVVRSTQYILGPQVTEFENAMARYHGVRHALGVASGTDALLLSLASAGIGEGDEVITTPFTFVATAEAIMHAGAKVVFADIDEETFNLDPELAAEKVGDRTKALLPVHLYGLPADMERFRTLAADRELRIVEDCAQSTGARVGDRRAGVFGDAAAFSFFPTKNLGGLGDGGMILTDDDEIASRVKMLRGHGSKERDCYEMLGFNSRLDSIQAAVLTVKLRRLDQWNELRRHSAALYEELLGDIDGLWLPREGKDFFHVYNQYTVRTDRRDQLREYLAGKGISTMVYYHRALHLQPVFLHLGHRAGDFPVTEKAQSQVLSLPVYPGLTEDEVRQVAAAIREFFEG